MLMKVNIFTCHWAAEEPCVLNWNRNLIKCVTRGVFGHFFSPVFLCWLSQTIFTSNHLYLIWCHFDQTWRDALKWHLNFLFKDIVCFRLWPFKMERCLPLITRHSLWPWYGREQFNQRVVFTFSYPLNQLLSPQVYVGACTYRYYNNCCYNQQSRFKHHVCNVIKLTTFLL